MDWQPIETAPKDDFLDLWVVGWSEGPLRLPDCKWREGAWQTYSDKWGHMLIEAHGCRVTHWRLRPAPPGDAAGLCERAISQEAKKRYPASYTKQAAFENGAEFARETLRRP